MENKSQSRRSFVDVRRKSLFLEKIFNEDHEVPASGQNLNLTMDLYFKFLERENLQWKDLLHLRKKSLTHVMNRCEHEVLQITENEIHPYLCEEDKIFLNDRPDYLNIMECARNYLKAISCLEKYASDVIDHYQEVVEGLKTETTTLVEYLSQNVCDLCNMHNCIDVDHKYPVD